VDLTRPEIVAASPYRPISALSGGNQQKVVLSRPPLTQPKVLTAGEPAAGSRRQGSDRPLPRGPMACPEMTTCGTPEFEIKESG
jgi:hypothetical protein